VSTKLLFAAYWERGVEMTESVDVYVYVYVYAIIRRGMQVGVLRYVPRCLCPQFQFDLYYNVGGN
jgi:hypothetical protein